MTSLVTHGDQLETPAGARPLGVKVRPVLRLALGYRDEAKNGAPVKSDHFIARSDNDTALHRFAERYGDNAKTVRILLPAELNDALDIRYVAFKGAPGVEGGGNLVAIGQTNYALRDYMGGPDTVTVWNTDGTVSELEIDGPDDEQLGDIQLDLRTRLRFGIPDVLGFGSFAEVQTGGKESSDNLWLKTRELYAIFGSRVTVAVEPLLVLKPSTMRAPKFEGRGKHARQVGWQKTSLYVVDLVVPESIEEMLTRLRERQQVLAPNGAAAAIYGPPTATAALGPGSHGPTAEAPSPTPLSGDEEQAVSAGEPDTSPSGSPTVPDDDDDEPPLEGEIVEQGDLDVVSSFVVPDGYAASGQSLAQVAESPAGPLWLEWAIERPEKFPPEFAQALDTFVSLRFPEIYAKASSE